MTPIDEYMYYVERPQIIQDALRTLTYREREIIKLRYGLDDGFVYTLAECGRIFHVTRERVRQIEHDAMKKIKRSIIRQSGVKDGRALFDA
ncbi:MAG: sigma-70 family RNA polymerase sigma factor [Proteobacteria bacterium]|nr:sigma-70 family RNA polymerase sigma factor [Pseudomonadota bacterium]